MEPTEHLSLEYLADLARRIDDPSDETERASEHIANCPICRDRFRLALPDRGTALPFKDIDSEIESEIESQEADSCLEEAVMFRLVDGTSDVIEMELAEIHLESCLFCRMQLEGLRKFRESLEQETAEAVLTTPPIPSTEPATQETIISSVPATATPATATSTTSAETTTPATATPSFSQFLRHSIETVRSLFVRPQIAWGITAGSLALTIALLFAWRAFGSRVSDEQTLAQLKRNLKIAEEQANVACVGEKRALETQHLAEKHAQDLEKRLVATSASNNSQIASLQRQYQDTRNEAKATDEALRTLSKNAREGRKRVVELLASTIERPGQGSILLGPGAGKEGISLISPVDTAIETERPTFVWKIDDKALQSIKETGEETRSIVFEISLNDGNDVEPLFKEIPIKSIMPGKPVEWTPSDQELPISKQRRGVNYSWSVIAYRNRKSPASKLARLSSSGAYYTIPEERLLNKIVELRREEHKDPLRLAITLLKAGFHPDAENVLKRCVDNPDLNEIDKEVARQLLTTLKK